MWPFNPYPRNGVVWLPDANGIRFEHSGVIFTEGPLQAADPRPTDDACAIEVYLRPAPADDDGNILTFSSDNNPEALLLRQWGETLIIYRHDPPHSPGPKFAQLDANDTLRAGKLELLTISSGAHGTAVYVDGKLVASAAHFRIHLDDLYRQIFIGNSPTNFQVWHGEIRGLAIYNGELSPAEAAAHYAYWSAAPPATGNSTTSIPIDSNAQDAGSVLARYTFRERSGGIIHSDVASAPPLNIPVHFSVPRKPMLDSPINEFQWDANYRRDVFENIVGFMPLGFVLGGFFALSRSRAQAILISTLCGGFLSFSIEFLQYYIPRRGSGWTDVITNTTGTLLGALIAHPELVRGALRLVNLSPRTRNRDANGN
jgi:hypothetical protein